VTVISGQFDTRQSFPRRFMATSVSKQQSAAMRKALFVLLSVAAISAFWTPVAAQDSTPKESDFIVRNFRFQSGEELPELRIHYLTLGTPKRDAAGHVANAVLLLHGTTLSGKFTFEQIRGQLFGKGQPLDTEKYYLIMPDAIGHGGSSKPSDGLHAKFPRYGYSDMVSAQYRLVKEGLDVDHLLLVIGFSMGGMHTWVWGEKFPDMMDALMPITSQPIEIAGHNFIWRHVMTEAIRNDPEWNGGEYAKEPSHWLSVLPLLNMMVSTPSRLHATAPTRVSSNQLFDKVMNNGRKVYDANDFLYAFESSWDYNPEPDLGKVKAYLLALNFDDDMINDVRLKGMERAISKIPHARSVIITANGQSYGHLNQHHPEIWKAHLVELLNSLPGQSEQRSEFSK
jgi:homoserine O-acetyltransferase/O-succinyltransferase